MPASAQTVSVSRGKTAIEAGLDDITQYLEVVTIFEDDDDGNCGNSRRAQ